MESVIEKISKSLYVDECYNKEHSRIYRLHKYWARKPWYIVEKYIQNYSMPGDLVMDPFCGSGCTGLEAVMNGRNFVGQDLNPSALRVSRETLKNDVSMEKLEESFLTVEAACKDEIMNLYVTEEACPKCAGPLFFKYINIGPKFESGYTGNVYCPRCKSKGQKRLLKEAEIVSMKNSNDLVISKWVPNINFPQRFYKDRFSYKGIQKVTDMYTRRNLFALSLLLDEIKKITHEGSRNILLLAFSNTVLHSSKLKGENVRPLGVNNYWIPDDYYEENVWFRFNDRYNNILRGKKQQLKREKEKKAAGVKLGKWILKKKSALESMGQRTIDYVFTDPPYGDAIQYSELSYMWNAWFNENYETEEEIVINPVQNKGTEEFQELLGKALQNIYAALKNEKYFTLCFQNKNSSVWEAVINKCKELGFVLRDVSIYDTYGSPFNKSWANFSPKSDIYVTFQKGKATAEDFYNEKETITGIVSEITQYMRVHGIDKDNNKLYDLTIAYLIWAMYYNRNGVDIRKFDIKAFTKIANEIYK